MARVDFGAQPVRAVAAARAAAALQARQLPRIAHLDNWSSSAWRRALRCVEFFADKFRTWTRCGTLAHVHTRAGGPGVAFAATTEMSSTVQVLALLLAAPSRSPSHGTKATVRARLNLSPEPLSNWILSVVERAGDSRRRAVGLRALVALVPLAAFLVLFVWLMPKVLRRIRRMIASAARLLAGRAGLEGGALLTLLPASLLTSPRRPSAASLRS